jgi:hypothetical protein
MGMNRTNLEKRSTIVKIESNPFDSGKWVMKSMEIDSKHLFGIGSGCSNPAGFYVDTLFY